MTYRIRILKSITELKIILSAKFNYYSDCVELLQSLFSSKQISLKHNGLIVLDTDEETYKLNFCTVCKEKICKNAEICSRCIAPLLDKEGPAVSLPWSPPKIVQPLNHFRVTLPEHRSKPARRKGRAKTPRRT